MIPHNIERQTTFLAILEERHRMRGLQQQTIRRSKDLKIQNHLNLSRSAILKAQSHLLIEQNKVLMKRNKLLNLEFNFALQTVVLKANI